MAKPRTPTRRAQAHPSAPMPAPTPAAPAAAAEPLAPGRQRALRSDAGSGRSSDPTYVQLNVRIPEQLRRRVKLQLVDNRKLTASDIVEAALEAYLPDDD